MGITSTISLSAADHLQPSGALSAAQHQHQPKQQSLQQEAPHIREAEAEEVAHPQADHRQVLCGEGRPLCQAAAHEEAEEAVLHDGRPAEAILPAAHALL